MTKKEILVWFKETHRELLVQYRYDSIAKREMWNDYTDALCKDRVITNRQYESWANPF